MRNILFASVAVGAISFSGAALATVFLPVGANPLGPEFIITFGPGGAISTALIPVYGGSDPGPYDSVEDTYFGVINNSGSPINPSAYPARRTSAASMATASVLMLAWDQCPGHILRKVWRSECVFHQQLGDVSDGTLYKCHCRKWGDTYLLA